jgi:spore coat polysaccharide biosynthesis protein SpsF
MPLQGKPLFIRQAERVRAASLSGRVVIATTTDSNDDTIAEVCRLEGLDCYRGDAADLLDRHYQAALHYTADTVIKIPSDCPLIDPALIDEVIGYWLDHTGEYDFVSNLHPATWPDGNDVEIMTMAVCWRRPGVKRGARWSANILHLTYGSGRSGFASAMWSWAAGRIIR